MGLGRAWSGTWVGPFVVMLMLAATILASTVVLAEHANLRTASAIRATRHSKPLPGVVAILCRVPVAAWVCALVACLNAVSWSLITPPFQVTDEPSHFAYVKQLAETGSPPTSNGDDFSSEELFALQALRTKYIRHDPSRRAIFSQKEQDRLEKGLKSLSRSPHIGSPDAAVATAEPPLYYALESIPYRLASAGTLLDRVQVMRLFSALITGLTVLFTFLFLRETLPGVRSAWTVGALGVALSPLLGFMSGGINPDTLLFAVSAALFYCLARAFRRGLTTRLAVATGIVIAVGFLTKLSFIGIAPGALLALGILAVRGAKRSNIGAIRAAVIAASIGSSPVLVLVATDALSERSVLGVVVGTISSTHGSLLDVANYIWQSYLPRLPGTVNDFPGLSTARQIWFDGYVGRFGWLDTVFPAWVYQVALFVAGLIVSLCICALRATRGGLRSRLSEFAAYALITVGLTVLVGASGFREFPRQTAAYGQTRYLLPLLPLLGAVLALSARGAGQRWRPIVGTLIVTLLLAHDLFSQLQVVARYYG
jgi:hypothetical protein